jgi:hypothetical protein
MGDVERPYLVRPERLYTCDDLMRGWYPGADHSASLDGRIYAYVKILDRFPAQHAPLASADTPRRVLMRMRNHR